MSNAASSLPASLPEWLERIESLHPKGEAGIELGLDRMREALIRLDHAHFCPVIIVGGTNGKGSTVAYLEAIYLRAGYRVGAYTSPHLLEYNERIRMDGQPVSDTLLMEAFERIEKARVGGQGETSSLNLTYFEFGTLAAYEVFRTARVDVMILEVGLGGRLDAVNAYEPDVSIVTGIALDHTDWLGSTREAIGFEKAGIFRPGKPALCGDLDPPPSLTNHARLLGADARWIGRDFGFEASPEQRAQWVFWSRASADSSEGRAAHSVRRVLAYPALRGRAQLANASVALAAIECLRPQLSVPMQAIRRGLMEVELPGRFQVIPGDPVLVLDVAHNPQSMATLADNLSHQGFYSTTRAVLGMLADKDIASSLAELKGRIQHWYIAPLPGPRGASLDHLEHHLVTAGVGGSIQRYASVADAWHAARQAAVAGDRIAAFGSFLTVAGVLQAMKFERPAQIIPTPSS